MNLITRFDDYITQAISAVERPGLKKAASILTHLGDATLHIPLFTLFYIYGAERTREFVINSVTASLLGVALLYAIRLTVKRRRPIGDMPKEYALMPVLENYSFPSGHAMRNFIFPVTVFPYLGFYASISLAFFAAFITSTRVYLRLHYFSDIAAGALLGIFSAVLILKFF